MSNVEQHPEEEVSAAEPADRPEILEPREVPLGGQRALMVRRTLPQRARSLLGAWCFADSFGPTPASAARTMDTRPHPHTGLQTVSWLYAGKLEHRDSVGSLSSIVPGQVNLMTAGRGIQHSEVSTEDARGLHGVQLWVALPEAHRWTEPSFEHYVPPPVTHGDATVRVFLGDLLGQSAPLTTFSPLLAAQIDLPAGGEVRLPVSSAFEHGLLVDAGEPALNGIEVGADQLCYVPPGSGELVIRAGDAAVRALLLGGEPLGEEIVMWWNFVGRSHDEIVAFRREWQSEVIGGANPSGRFGVVRGYDGDPLPAPVLPNATLHPRH
ncbi:pirin family protein [Nocardioides marmotae]|uniref:pirin family protein n=1 Tax=Nocardioides marmotae TaxID=2663857 RepID=UPI00132C1FC9|nr:pirin family protein [Nocardioides marmotae]MBC9734970.1 pirin family protein [Nocardioides marmotae]MTB86070.1 pirin family protein [Nocardioides marmotae]